MIMNVSVSFQPFCLREYYYDYTYMQFSSNSLARCFTSSGISAVSMSCGHATNANTLKQTILNEKVYYLIIESTS